jgi:hypothetical protein
MNEGKESMKSQETFHCCNIFFLLLLLLFLLLLLLLPANYCIKAPISFTKITQNCYISLHGFQVAL